MPAPQLVTRAAFAAHCNVTPTAVGHWIRDRILRGSALVGTGRSMKIDVKLGMAQVAARRDASQALGNGRKTAVRPVPSAARPASRANERHGADADENADYERERALLTRENRIAREMSNAVKKGDLIPSAAVETRYANFTTTIRSRMLTVPARVKEALPKLTASDVAAVDAVVRAVLTEASRADLA